MCCKIFNNDKFLFNNSNNSINYDIFLLSILILDSKTFFFIDNSKLQILLFFLIMKIIKSIDTLIIDIYSFVYICICLSYCFRTIDFILLK